MQKHLVERILTASKAPHLPPREAEDAKNRTSYAGTRSG